MNILIFEWGTYTHNDMINVFERLGHKCNVVRKHSFRDINEDEEFVEGFTQVLKDGAYDFVYSTNYFPLVAKCCNKTGHKYISWSYDAPLNVPNIENTLGLPCNYVFMYDREQYGKYKDRGFDNVYHLPLAVDTKRLDKIKLSEEDRHRYGSQISFVGNLYKSEMLNIRSIIDEYNMGYIDALMAVQSKLYGYYIIDELLDDAIIDSINEVIHDKSVKHRMEKSISESALEDKPVLKVSREALSYAMAAQITREERILILKLLSNHYRVKLFSRDNCELLEKVEHMGAVDYDTEMVKVFKASDINLNICLKCIRTGIPLRALDIMGSGGFLLSNYQEELAESFADGEEVVMYSGIEDMYEKVGYYLKNDRLRMDIAARGYAKVSRNFRYENRIKFMMDTAGI